MKIEKEKVKFGLYADGDSMCGKNPRISQNTQKCRYFSKVAESKSIYESLQIFSASITNFLTMKQYQ